MSAEPITRTLTFVVYDRLTGDRLVVTLDETEHDSTPEQTLRAIEAARLEVRRAPDNIIAFPAHEIVRFS